MRPPIQMLTTVRSIWRQRRFSCIALTVASLVITTFIGPMLPISVQRQSADILFDRYWSPFQTSYYAVISGSTPPSVPDPDQFNRHVRAQVYDVRGWGSITWAFDTRFLFWTLIEWGFPMRCLRGWEANDDLRRLVASRGVVSLPAEWQRVRMPKFAPSTPIPHAIIINVAVHATAWFMLLVMLEWWRHNRRVRRGLCAECGYDLRGNLALGCPECGTGRVA